MLISHEITFEVGYYDVFDHDTSTSRTDFVNFAAFTVLMTLNLAKKSSEVIDLGTNPKRLCDFLLNLNRPSNLGPISPRFRDIRFCTPKAGFRYPSSISGCSLGAYP